MVSELLDTVDAMRPGDFFPEGARDADKPYIERHTIAGGSWAYTLWEAGFPLAVNLDHTYQAVDAFIRALGLDPDDETLPTLVGAQRAGLL